MLRQGIVRRFYHEDTANTKVVKRRWVREEEDLLLQLHQQRVSTKGIAQALGRTLRSVATRLSAGRTGSLRTRRQHGAKGRDDGSLNANITMPSSPTRRLWTSDEQAQLEGLLAQDYSYNAIAAEMSRSPDSIKHRVVRFRNGRAKSLESPVLTITEKRLIWSLKDQHHWDWRRIFFTHFPHRKPLAVHAAYVDTQRLTSCRPRPWTHDEEQTLLQRRAAGTPWLNIATEINRSIRAAMTKHVALTGQAKPIRRKWTVAENQRLCEMRAAGMTYTHIGRVLGRHRATCCWRWSLLQVQDEGEKMKKNMERQDGQKPTIDGSVGAAEVG